MRKPWDVGAWMLSLLDVLRQAPRSYEPTGDFVKIQKVDAERIEREAMMLAREIRQEMEETRHAAQEGQ